jgi:hypothetical protein
VARASCWPLPQQLLPVSAAGGGRRCCSGRIILNFGVQKRLRAFLYPFFTGAPPERADFPSFRLKFHVLGRKSQTIKQNAQKGGAKFGGGGLDRSREKIFKKQNDELKRVIATK